ncbi:MAG: immunoglobulin domain-containing protein [Methylococcaceae bacterium]
MPPKWISLPSNQSVVLGSRALFLNCLAKGSPTPTVKWSRSEGMLWLNRFFFKCVSVSRLHQIIFFLILDEEVLKNSSRFEILSNGTLIIRDLARTDEGEYNCDVSNGVHPDLSGDIIVTVGSKCKAKFGVITTTINELLELLCITRQLCRRYWKEPQDTP